MKNNIVKVFSTSKKTIITNFLRGYTLAEILAVIIILGIVAAITIPNTVKYNQEKETVVRLKMFASQLDNAIEQAKVLYGPIETWVPAYQNNCSVITGTDNEGNPIFSKPNNGNYSCTSALFSDILAQYMPTELNCGTDRTKVCFQGEKKHKLFNNNNWVAIDTTNNYSRFKLKNGMSVWVYVQSNFPKCGGNTNFLSGSLKKLCAAVGVDVNGAKGPNRMGYDTFYFWVTPDNVIPNGVNDDDAYDVDRGGCSYSKGGGKGYGCAAYLLKYGTMEYKRREVSLHE